MAVKQPGRISSPQGNGIPIKEVRDTDGEVREPPPCLMACARKQTVAIVYCVSLPKVSTTKGKNSSFTERQDGRWEVSLRECQIGECGPVWMQPPAGCSVQMEK